MFVVFFFSRLFDDLQCVICVYWYLFSFPPLKDHIKIVDSQIASNPFML